MRFALVASLLLASLEGARGWSAARAAGCSAEGDAGGDAIDAELPAEEEDELPGSFDVSDAKVPPTPPTTHTHTPPLPPPSPPPPPPQVFCHITW
ncbi:hypothetical protein T492DRAFT_974639 [Pavlovales sp. CCMP2436]|nr:hypothetical protein T492DRAFT_974639 [Pavlovales sp. CCMP2436]